MTLCSTITTAGYKGTLFFVLFMFRVSVEKMSHRIDGNELTSDSVSEKLTFINMFKRILSYDITLT